MVVGTATQSAKRQTKVVCPIEFQVQKAISRIAECECPVLIVGEPGAGKRSIAAQIHAQSRRSRNDVIEISAAAATPSVLAEVAAERETIYMPEIGDLSLESQGWFVDLYFRAAAPPAARFLFGTNRELIADVKLARMREDFYYLISAVTLRITPLRCRRSEILLIVDDLLDRYARQFDRPRPELEDEMAGFLLEHVWPENFTELQTAIKTFVAIGDQSVSLAALKAAAANVRSNGNRRQLSLKEASRAASSRIERELIAEVLVATGGNRKRAADELGISYKALLYKLKQVEGELQPASNKNGVNV